MCTAISYKTKEHYFGRNLDLEYSYIESVAITPRNYAFHFRKERLRASLLGPYAFSVRARQQDHLRYVLLRQPKPLGVRTFRPQCIFENAFGSPIERRRPFRVGFCVCEHGSDESRYEQLRQCVSERYCASGELQSLQPQCFARQCRRMLF